MSFRIDRIMTAEGLAVLNVSGRLSGDNVEVFRQILEREDQPFAIDLGNVVLADRETVKILAQSEVDGHELRNCPLYIREWITCTELGGRSPGIAIP